jgi:GTPase
MDDERIKKLVECERLVEMATEIRKGLVEIKKEQLTDGEVQTLQILERRAAGALMVLGLTAGNIQREKTAVKGE